MRPVGTSLHLAARTSPPTLVSATRPEAGSACPMFDLVDPMSKGSWRVVHRARVMPFSSWGSPTCGGHGGGQDSTWHRGCGYGCGRGPHHGARAVRFDVLKGLRGHPGRIVQRANELLLRLSGGEGHACGEGRASVPWPPTDCGSPAATAPQPAPTLLLEAIGVGACIQDGGIHPPGQGLLGQQDSYHSLRAAVAIP